jgi:hypothetical protein
MTTGFSNGFIQLLTSPELRRITALFYSRNFPHIAEISFTQGLHNTNELVICFDDLERKDTAAKEELEKSSDLTLAFNGLRLSNLMVINVLWNLNQMKEAKELFTDMEKRFPPDKLIFSSNEMRDYYNSIKSFVGL